MNITKAGSHGILLPDLNIEFDYSGTKEGHTFISHAHSDHMPSSKKSRIFCTPATCKLMQARGFQGDVQLLDFKNPIELDNTRITLYPAGHILGSAMVFVESDDANVLYTGDYRTPPSPTSEGFYLPDEPVDHLITEATFGLPIYKWNSHDKIAEEVRQFASQSLDEGYTPIFMAYDLGKAQEIMHMLAPLNQLIQVGQNCYKLCQIYEEAGFNIGSYELFSTHQAQDGILITTRRALNNGFASTIWKKRIAYCSGWAVKESYQSYTTANKRIPLSDHLDFFELINLCKKLNPKKVHITHTPNADVVQHYLEEANIASQFLDA